MKTARELAFEVLRGVEFDDSYANLLFNKLQGDSKLEAREAALAQEIAFGAIRWRRFYQRIIEICSKRKISEIDRNAQLLLLMGTHQLLSTRIPPHAAISETVEQSKGLLNVGGVGFINGVLRRVSERSLNEWMELCLKGLSDSNEKLSIEYSHPEWIVRAFDRSLELDGRLGELNSLLESDNEPAKVNLVALPGFVEQQQMLDLGLTQSKSSPIGYELSSGNPAKLGLVRAGLARVQDAGSQLVALAMVEAAPVKDGEEWLDLCAGPGGKAALLAALAMREGATLTCNEIAPHRSKMVEQALSPINPNIYVRTGDGRELGEDAPEAFDRILIDAPCTGLGSLRRKPEARWRKNLTDLSDLVKLQKELLTSAWQGLKQGGILVYSTCSPHLSETVSIIDWSLKNLSGIEVLDGQQIIQSINPGIEFGSKRKTVQLWPHVHQTDAMFLAVLHKRIG